MRIVLLFTLFALSLHALEITVSKGVQDKEAYSVIELFNDDPFLCQPQYDSYGNTNELICSFSKVPRSGFKPVENEFFIITPKRIKKNFFLIIRAKYRLYFRPIIFDLVKDATTFEPKTSISRHWVVVGYEKNLPLIRTTQESENAINFPFYMDTHPLPYVGGLDLQGNPVHIKNSEDVRAYVQVKNLFKNKKYDECIEQADEVLQFYPDTLFKSELLYYKIKSFFKLRAYETVIELSKEFLREYSSDENIPEILMLTAVSYFKNGQYTDADYFFERLFLEHSNSKFTQWGYIYKGDMAVDSGEDSKAEKFYKRALTSTKDMEIATTAAFKLAQMYIRQEKFSEAKKYLEKILKANDEYFYKHYDEAKELMFALAEHGDFLEAANIDEAILKYMNRREDDYESNLRYLGVWLAKTPQKKRALKALERYIKEFNDGLYIDEVEKTRDGLFFDTKSKDTKELLAKYDRLIEMYGDDPIGQKALYEKAKLMLSRKMYSDLLQIQKQIESLDSELYPDKEELIKKAALGLMENALKSNQCQVVLDIQKDYNVTVSSKWDFGLYECFIKAADFNKAKAIAKRNLSTSDLQEKRKWLYYYIKVDFETGNYSEVIDAAKDLIAMIDDMKKSPYKDVYRILFDAYERLGDFDGMIRTIEKIEELFGLSYKDIDRYVDMINVGVAKKDDNIIIKYGKKLYELQERTDSHAQSPFVEFALYQAYMNKEEYKKALEVISSLDNVELDKKDRARQQYLKGMVLDKLWRNDEAIEAYKKAIEADADSAWAKLAKSALELEE